jgi:choloylglycine hydrolase
MVSRLFSGGELRIIGQNSITRRSETRMKALRVAVMVAALAVGQLSPAGACTGIRLIAADGSVVCARTLEFGMDLQSSLIVIPRGTASVGSTANGQPGLPWTTKYGAVGTNAFGMSVIIDGVNEQGLACGLFYFPGYAQYQQVAPEDTRRSLAPWELGAFLLGTTADVKDAVAAVREVLVGAVVQKDFGFVPPCHFVLHDAKGNSAVIEYVDGKLTVHDNPLGVITNSPTFDWHITNLRNYANLSVTNVPPVELVGVRLSGFGQGNGLLGLPGDFTPPSRFVRAVAFSRSSVASKTAADATLHAFHILNQFDIPKGAVREVSEGQEHMDYTLWTSAADLANRRYHFRTYDNCRIRMVDLKKLDLDAKSIKTISMAGEEAIEDVTGLAK